MENRISIAKLLQDCPKGMELDCVMCDNVTFKGILDGNCYPIQIETPEGDMQLNQYGCMSFSRHAKCVIFPKGKTTWEGFQRPFKDGDVVAHQNHMGTWIGIYHKHDYLNGYFSSYCCIGRDGKFWADFNNRHGYDKTRLATEEERQKLFQAIKDNGYKWNAETKTLEKLVEPKFKVGDRIAHKNGITKPFVISQVGGGYYYANDKNAVGMMRIEDQDNYELVPDKFDITTLIPFESRVLVRDYNYEKWFPGFWGCYDRDSDCERPFITVGWALYKQCIPYEGNEHLIGKTDDCDEFYKTWE